MAQYIQITHGPHSTMIVFPNPKRAERKYLLLMGEYRLKSAFFGQFKREFQNSPKTFQWKLRIPILQEEIHGQISTTKIRYIYIAHITSGISLKRNFSSFAQGPFVFWLLANLVDLCMAPFLLFLSTIPITEGFIQNMKQFFLQGNMGAFFLTNMAIWVQFFLTNAIWVQRICYFLVFFPWLDISNASQLARPVSQFCLGYFLPIS